MPKILLAQLGFNRLFEKLLSVEMNGRKNGFSTGFCLKTGRFRPIYCGQNSTPYRVREPRSEEENRISTAC